MTPLGQPGRREYLHVPGHGGAVQIVGPVIDAVDEDLRHAAGPVSGYRQLYPPAAEDVTGLGAGNTGHQDGAAAIGGVVLDLPGAAGGDPAGVLAT